MDDAEPLTIAVLRQVYTDAAIALKVARDLERRARRYGTKREQADAMRAVAECEATVIQARAKLRGAIVREG